MHHLFFWHLPIDSRLPYGLARKHGAFSINPITYSAVIAQRVLQSGGVETESEIMSSINCRQLFDEALLRCDSFFACASARGYGSVTYTDYESVSQAIFYVSYFKHFARNIIRERGQGQFVNYPFVAANAVPGLLLLIQRFLDIVIDEANGFIKLGRHDQIRLQRARLASVLSQNLRSPASGITGPDGSTSASPPVDLLILALEESDRRSQAPLVKRLIDIGVSLKWCCVEGNRMAVSHDERALDSESIDPAYVCALPQQIARDYKWKRSWMREWHRQALWYQTYDCLNHAGLGEWSPLLRWQVAKILSSFGTDRLLTWRGVSDLVLRFRPKLAVMSSVYGAMSTAHACLEEHRVPLVRLPHGVENVLQAPQRWRNAAVGRFGQVEVELLQSRQPEQKATFHAIGSYHLGRQARQGVKRSHAAWPEGMIQILYPVSWGYLFFPDTQLDIEGDLIAIDAAAQAVNAALTVRCHPRQKEWDYFDYQLMRDQHGASAKWQLSDGSTSLVESLDSSHIVLIRTWSGSGLQALYAKKPIVAWMPRAGLEFADHILSLFPCKATTGQELQMLLKKLIDDSGYREQVIEKQGLLLEYLVKDPYGDPYAGAEKLVLDTLREVKGSEV